MDRKTVTQDILLRMAHRDDVHMLIVGEPNKKIARSKGWLVDERLDAALVTVSRDLPVHSSGKGRGYVWAELEEVVVYGCYCSPNVGIEVYESFIADLGEDVRRQRKPVIVAGDLNAKASEWGSPVGDARGAVAMDWISGAGLAVLNRGGRPTFVRYEQRSWIDVTLCTEGVVGNIKNWSVLEEEENLGWHRTISFGFLESRRPRISRRIEAGWKVSEGRLDAFRARFAARADRGEASPRYEEFIACVAKCCDESFPRRGSRPGRREAYWWCPEVGARRAQCLGARRRMTRANRNGTPESQDASKQNYRVCRRNYRNAILRAKRDSWRGLLTDLDRDEWGQGYRLVVKRTGVGRCGKMSDEMQWSEARRLFPVVEDDLAGRRAVVGNGVVDPRPFTAGELDEAVARIRKGKAPGPDGVPPEVAGAVLRLRPGLFLDVANAALSRGEFPRPMKEAKLVLIPKPIKNDGDPKTYRPISLLSVFGKVLEAMLESRLRGEIEERGGLHEKQHGFRRGRSTLGAMSEVVEVARAATRKAAQHKDFCALVTLDVRNAFGVARWSGIIRELERRGISSELIQLTRSYLSERALLVGGLARRLGLTCGVPQGSVLGPLLWNVYYDGVFGAEVPDGVTLVGYADDLAVVAVAKTGTQLKAKIDLTLVGVTEWLRGRHLELAPEKTEVVLLSGRRRLPDISVRVGDNEIVSRRCLKYLGVWFDMDMKMTEHVKNVTSRASDVATRLCRLMPNIGGPRSSKRRVIAGTVNSIVLYGAPIWSGALRYEKYRQMVVQVQRRVGLRICSAYRTVSTEAVQVIAGVIPLDLLVEERTAAFRARNVDGGPLRQNTMEQWQKRWDDLQGKAAWTRRLITDVAAWAARTHGEVGYHLSQFLSGHGCFRSYLYRFKRSEAQSCIYCGGDRDTAEHTVFECPRWECHRINLGLEVGEVPTPDNVVNIMLRKPATWESVNSAIIKILKRKEEDERAGVHGWTP